MIQLADKKYCTGCSSCMDSCPKHAINMREDREGFLFPVIDEARCIGCGLCVRRCPELAPPRCPDCSAQKAYAVISNDYRRQSSSGGAFSLLAGWVIGRGGVVFGAACDDRLAVRHIGVDSMDLLYRLRGSKYVQSEIGDCYVKVRKLLDAGRMVLFSGTGCQVAGLYAFLGGKRYEKQLVTIDLVCHGVPSPGCFESYLRKLSQALGGKTITEFRFRKLDSWDYRPAVQLPEGKWHVLRLSENVYMDAFFDGITFRESCFHCRYCNTRRMGTVTLADFWGVGQHGKRFSKNVAAGVSLVIDNVGMVSAVKAELEKHAYVEERPMDEAVAGQHNLKQPVARRPQRDTAITDLMDEHITLAAFARKYGYPYRPTLKTAFVGLAKDLIYALGLYNVYKTIIYKFDK